MHNRQFIPEQQGGLLKKAQHKQLIHWACACTEHVLPLWGENIDENISYALTIAKAWANDEAPVDYAVHASFGAVETAREASTAIEEAIARAAGHAAATAHVPDHAKQAADYALKAIQLAGKSVEEERQWQEDQLPTEIKDMVLAARAAQ